MEKKSNLLTSFQIAGFTYYEGALAFKHLTIGKKLKLIAEPENRNDDHAVALYMENFKLGYVPRGDNKAVALLLNNGYDAFEALVQQINPEEHPEAQVRVAVLVKPQNS